MTRRRKEVIALLAIGLAAVVSVGVLLAGDIYVHRKFENSGGVNIWGYRGSHGRPQAHWRAAGGGSRGRAPHSATAFSGTRPFRSPSSVC